MLVKKLNGEPFTTEYPMPEFDRVAPGKAIKDLTKARIALVTSGGIVLKVIQIISNHLQLQNLEFMILVM